MSVIFSTMQFREEKSAVLNFTRQYAEKNKWVGFLFNIINGISGLFTGLTWKSFTTPTIS